MRQNNGKLFQNPAIFIFELFQNPAILFIHYFQRTQGTSIPSNNIYFMRTIYKWIVCDVKRPFGN